MKWHGEHFRIFQPSIEESIGSTETKYIKPSTKTQNNVISWIFHKKWSLGAIFILRKDIGVGGWSRKWQFFLTLCSKMSLRRWVGGSKKAPKHPYIIFQKCFLIWYYVFWVDLDLTLEIAKNNLSLESNYKGFLPVGNPKSNLV